MKIKNHFFERQKNIPLSVILKILGKKNIKKNIKINDISNLKNASKNDISFFNNIKYIDILKRTKAKYIISSDKYLNLIKNYCEPIIVSNVLNSVYSITALFYPESLNDVIDFSAKTPNQKDFKKVKFGNNVLIGKNVKIGNNSIIGHNTIIESNVILGKNCSIGNNILIKNSILGDNVRVLDGAIIGKKGFGFFPGKKKEY